MFACCLTACTINNKIYSSASETGQIKAKYVLYVSCTQTDVFIAMELMGTCAEKLKKRIQGPIPERILGKMTVAVSRKNLNTHKNCKTCLFGFRKVNVEFSFPDSEGTAVPERKAWCNPPGCKTLQHPPGR